MKNARPLVLCVDDDATVLYTRKLVLEAAGFLVELATSGEEGLHLFRSRDPSAVVVDYDMEGMNGAQLATSIKEINPQLPVVMLSGFPALPDDCKSVVDAFVQKGQRPDVLTNTLASLMFVRSHRHPELDADCVAFVSPTGHYVDVSNGVCRLLGYGRAQLVGRHIADITAPASANVQQMFAEYRKAGEQHGFYVLRACGGRHVVIRYRAHAFDDGCLAAVWQPLETERKAPGSAKPSDHPAEGDAKPGQQSASQ